MAIKEMRMLGGPLLQPGRWVVDEPTSEVAFAIVHFKAATVHGRFREFEGAVEADERGAVSATARVRVDSLDTGNPVRDRKLLGRDYFDAARHPEIRFAAHDGHGGRLPGSLSMAGTTYPIELRLRAGVSSRDRLALVAWGELSRAAFGIDRPELRVAGVSDTVSVAVRVSLRRAGSLASAAA